MVISKNIQEKKKKRLVFEKETAHIKAKINALKALSDAIAAKGLATGQITVLEKKVLDETTRKINLLQKMLETKQEKKLKIRSLL